MQHIDGDGIFLIGFIKFFPMRTVFTFPILLSFFIGFTLSASAQPVVADKVVDHSADWIHPARATDGDPESYTYVTSLLHLLSTSYLQLGFPVDGRAGDIVEFQVSAADKLLGLDLLTNTQLKVYDDKGKLVETLNSGALLNLALLEGPRSVYSLRFLTDFRQDYRFREVRIEFHELLSLNLLEEFRVHQVFYSSPCPPVEALSVFDYKSASILSPSRVLNPQNAVDQDLATYATMEVPLNLLGIFPPAYLDLDFGSRPAQAGDYMGVTISQASTLLSLSLLSNLEMQVFDQNGVMRESRDGFTLVDLKLLSGSTDVYSLGFQTAEGDYSLGRLRIVLKGVVNLLHSLRVHNAFHFRLDRPILSVEADGPTRFCQGGSVTLRVTNPGDFTSFKWNTGSTASSLTVTQTGTYTVTATNGLGCSSTSLPIRVEVSSDQQPVVHADLRHNPCPGDSKGAIEVQVSGGSGNYEYQWAHGPQTKDIDLLPAGLYQLSVRDQLTGCQRQDSFRILEPEALKAQMDILGDDTCTAEKDGAIEVLVSGGTAPYYLLWSTGDTTSRIQGLDTGTYVLEVKDAQGCRDIWEALVARSACRDTTGGGDDDDDDDDDEDDTPPGPGTPGIIINEVITPNGDGANDTWVIEGLSLYSRHSIQVFNKWGDKVFDSRNYLGGWDGSRSNGEPLPDGTYFYLIRLHQDSPAVKEKVYTGSLLIQR